jgi:hypothetical protein
MAIFTGNRVTGDLYSIAVKMQAAGRTPMWTFDERAARLPGVERLPA